MKRILLAYDGTEPARRALEMAADFAKRYEAPLSVVSAIPVHGGRAPIDPWDDPATHRGQLQEARQLLRQFGIEAEMLEPAGDPAEAIERVAEAGGFDTIVVGSRGLGAVGRFLQGSVSEHVATHARATVVIARQPLLSLREPWAGRLKPWDEIRAWASEIASVLAARQPTSVA